MLSASSSINLNRFLQISLSLSTFSRPYINAEHRSLIVVHHVYLTADGMNRYFIFSSLDAAFLRMSIAVAERLVDEKARSKMVVLDTSSEKGALQLKSYIASADLQAILAHGQNRGGEDG